MRVQYTEQIERTYYSCDICGEKVIQDGSCTLIREFGVFDGVQKWSHEPTLHFHTRCLQDFLRSNLPNLKG